MGDISNDTFIEALNSIDNKKIINSVLRNYHNTFSKDELESIGNVALWKALLNHKDGFGRQFTTSLYQYTLWEVLISLREVNKYNKVLNSHVGSGTMDNIPAKVTLTGEEQIEIKDALNTLSPKYKDAIFEYFVENRTLSEISKRHDIGIETIRKRIKQGIQTLKDKCN